MLRAMLIRMDDMEEAQRRGVVEYVHDVSDEEVETPQDEVEEVESLKERIINELTYWRGRPNMETTT